MEAEGALLSLDNAHHMSQVRYPGLPHMAKDPSILPLGGVSGHENFIVVVFRSLFNELLRETTHFCGLHIHQGQETFLNLPSFFKGPGMKP